MKSIISKLDGMYGLFTYFKLCFTHAEPEQKNMFLFLVRENYSYTWKVRCNIVLFTSLLSVFRVSYLREPWFLINFLLVNGVGPGVCHMATSIIRQLKSRKIQARTLSGYANSLVAGNLMDNNGNIPGSISRLKKVCVKRHN